MRTRFEKVIITHEIMHLIVLDVFVAFIITHEIMDLIVLHVFIAVIEVFFEIVPENLLHLAHKLLRNWQVFFFVVPQRLQHGHAHGLVENVQLVLPHNLGAGAVQFLHEHSNHWLVFLN